MIPAAIDTCARVKQGFDALQVVFVNGFDELFANGGIGWDGAWGRSAARVTPCRNELIGSRIARRL